MQWRRVTWYSIVAAFVLFVTIPVWAFFLGTERGRFDQVLEQIDEQNAAYDAALSEIQTRRKNN